MIQNSVHPVPGSSVTVHLGINPEGHNPTLWFYSLWEGKTMTHTGRVDLAGLDVTPRQVARIAFLLEVDYASA